MSKTLEQKTNKSGKTLTINEFYTQKNKVYQDNFINISKYLMYSVKPKNIF